MVSGKKFHYWPLLCAGLAAPLACGSDRTESAAGGASATVAAGETSGGASGGVSDADGGASGSGRRTYPCSGGFVYISTGGQSSFGGAGGIDYRFVEEIPWMGGSSGVSSCVVGQTYCEVRSVADVEIGVPPTQSCANLSGPLAACANAPNCACICSHGGCGPPCTCADSGGLATVSCQEN